MVSRKYKKTCDNQKNFQAQAQNPEFVESMLQLHQNSASSFNLISYMTESTHESMLSYFIEFNVGAVKELSEGCFNTLCVEKIFFQVFFRQV